MKIHPEMRDTMNARMTEGLRFWSKKTPKEIEERVRAEMLRDQKALLNVDALKSSGCCLTAVPCLTRCSCSSTLLGKMHTPWCEGKLYYEFVTEKLRGTQLNLTDWRTPNERI